MHGVAEWYLFAEALQTDLRRIEDAAYGLRFDLRRSLVPQPPLGLFGDEPGNTSAAARQPTR